MDTPQVNSVVDESLNPSGSTTGLGHVVGDVDAVDLSHGTILYLDDITVSFDGFKALNALTLTVNVGELRCVIGPNGAGKTTMMDVITGKTRPDEGTAFFGQTIDLTRLTEPQIAHAGIGRKFQKPTVFENHTVFENLELAMKTDKRVRPTLLARLSVGLAVVPGPGLLVTGKAQHRQAGWLPLPFERLVSTAADDVLAACGLHRGRCLGHVLLVLLGVGDLHVDDDVGGGHGVLVLSRRSRFRAAAAA